MELSAFVGALELGEFDGVLEPSVFVSVLEPGTLGRRAGCRSHRNQHTVFIVEHVYEVVQLPPISTYVKSHSRKRAEPSRNHCITRPLPRYLYYLPT